MVTRARNARLKQSSGRAMQGYSKKVHAVERGFWSAGKKNVMSEYV